MAFQELVRGKSAIAVIDRTKQKKTLVDGWLEVSGLAWTAEGNEVWFAGKGEDSGWGIYGTTLSGTVRLILRFPGPVRLEDLAPDGRLLVNRFSAQSGIRYLAAGASQEKDLSWLDSSSYPSCRQTGNGFCSVRWVKRLALKAPCTSARPMARPPFAWVTGGALAFSPDGKWALTMARSRQELALLPVGVGRRVLIPLPANFDRFEAGIWLRDGRLLVSAIEHGHDPCLYVLPIGGQPHAISPEGLVSRPVISPDGRQVLIAINDKTVMLKVDGGEPVPVVAIEADESPVGWSADGQSVLVLAPATCRRVCPRST